MAWVSLLIVVLIFFIPGIDFCQSIVEQNAKINIPIGSSVLGLQIPFTGPFKLLFWAGLTWLIIWIILTYLTFNNTKTKNTFQNFFKQILIADKPMICLQFPNIMAKLTIALVAAKIFFTILILGGVELIGWLVKDLMFDENSTVIWLIEFILNNAEFVNKFASPWLLSAFVLSLMILLINKISEREKKRLIHENTQLKLAARKLAQDEIKIPVTQHS